MAYWMVLFIQLIAAPAGQIDNPGQSEDAVIQRTLIADDHPDLSVQISTLQDQLNRIVLPDGELIDPDDPSQIGRLAAITTECSTLYVQAADEDEKLHVAELELRALYALIRQSLQSNRFIETSFRLSQLRNLASRIAGFQSNHAKMIGDFWQLLADLVILNTREPDLAGRQLRAIDKLESYLRRYEASEEADRMIYDLQLCLVQLYHEAGCNRQACLLLTQIRNRSAREQTIPGDVMEAERICDWLDRPLVIHAVKTDGTLWRSEQLRSELALVCLIQHNRDLMSLSAAEVNMLEDYRARIDNQDLDLSFIAIEMDNQSLESFPWPVYQLDEKSADRLRNTGIVDMPVWLILKKGQLQALAQTSAILNQLDLMLPSTSTVSTTATRNTTSMP